MTKWFVYIFLAGVCLLLSCGGKSVREKFAEADRLVNENNLAYIIHSGFISGYQNRYGDNLKPPTNVYHRMTA